MWTQDNAFAFNARITVRNYNTECCICMQLLLLDDIKLHLPRMQCKGDNMAPKFGLFFSDRNGRKYPLAIELGALKIGE